MLCFGLVFSLCIIVCDHGEARFVMALQMMGLLRHVVITTPHLHNIFKLGFCLVTRQVDALALRKLALLCTSLKPKQVTLLWCFELQLNKAANLNNILARAFLSLLALQFLE